MKTEWHLPIEWAGRHGSHAYSALAAVALAGLGLASLSALWLWPIIMHGTNVGFFQATLPLGLFSTGLIMIAWGSVRLVVFARQETRSLRTILLNELRFLVGFALVVGAPFALGAALWWWFGF